MTDKIKFLFLKVIFHGIYNSIMVIRNKVVRYE
jgi:hypothetical protein